jgi:predicted O-methyltransferase YrrM
MHDRLASTTEDGPARVMHQAMAAEFRRRASELGTGTMPPPAQGPLLEMVATIG